MPAEREQACDPMRAAELSVENGAGEILFTSIDREGTYQDYDKDLIRRVTPAVNIPVIACSGAISAEDLVDVIVDAGVAAAAVGSLMAHIEQC